MNGAALITGGTRGIGLGIALRLAEEGWDLLVCGVREEAEVEAALERLRQHHTRVFYSRADVAEVEARTRLMAVAHNRLGRLNVLVNNAGVGPTERRDILEATEESFERLMRINLQGPYFLTQSAARWMIEQKKASPEFSGCIVNVSSISATAASTNRGDYCISKAGIAMATALWAVRLAEYGIPVYEIRPGIVGTDMTSKVRDKYDRLIADGLLLQARWGTPDDVGKAVAMLARGDLGYSTGQVIHVDGGFRVQRL